MLMLWGGVGSVDSVCNGIRTTTPETTTPGTITPVTTIPVTTTPRPITHLDNYPCILYLCMGMSASDGL